LSKRNKKNSASLSRNEKAIFLWPAAKAQPLFSHIFMLEKKAICLLFIFFLLFVSFIQQILRKIVAFFVFVP